MSPEYLTADEVAEVIRKSPDYVRRLCASGELPARKLGNEWRIHAAALEQFMTTPARTSATRIRPQRRRAS